MTVAELIERLSKMPQDANVVTIEDGYAPPPIIAVYLMENSGQVVVSPFFEPAPLE